jgi:hypothetical protein
MNNQRSAGENGLLTVNAAKLRFHQFRQCYYGVPDEEFSADLPIACELEHAR